METHARRLVVCVLGQPTRPWWAAYWRTETRQGTKWGVLGTTGESAMWQSNSSMGFLVRCKDWGWSGRLRLAPGGICAAHRQHLRRFPVSVARAPPDHPDHGLHPSPEGVGPITAVHPPVELQRLLGIKVDHIRHAGVAVAPSDWPRLVDWLRAHSPTGAEGAIAGLARRQGQREAAGRLLPPRDGTGGGPQHRIVQPLVLAGVVSIPFGAEMPHPLSRCSQPQGGAWHPLGAVL